MNISRLCASSDCSTPLSPGMVVIEVGSFYFCPRHVREVTIGLDGQVPPRGQEVIFRRRPPVEEPWEDVG